MQNTYLSEDTQVFEKEIHPICCCIWCNTWCWMYLVNWKIVCMIFVWAGFLLFVLLGKSSLVLLSKLILIIRTRWNLLVQLDFIQLKFLIAYLYWKFKKSWFVLKKCIAMSPQKHWVISFHLKFVYLGFILYLHIVFHIVFRLTL